MHLKCKCSETARAVFDSFVDLPANIQQALKVLDTTVLRGIAGDPMMQMASVLMVDEALHAWNVPDAESQQICDKINVAKDKLNEVLTSLGPISEETAQQLEIPYHDFLAVLQGELATAYRKYGQKGDDFIPAGKMIFPSPKSIN